MAFAHTLSHAIGALADVKLPRFLRAPLFRLYARLYRVELDEVRLALPEHPSFTAFFIRRLQQDARPFAEDPDLLPSPADGRFQAIDEIAGDTVLQAKGMPYSVAELLGGAPEGVELDGGAAWTIYLSPRDYHRVHAPIDCRLVEVRWIQGERRPVKPSVLARTPRVFATNERAVLRLEGERGPLFLVMVGALNVGRIRVVGVPPGGSPPEGGSAFARGAELARFELGSTVVLIAPREGGPRPADVAVGEAVRMGSPIGRWPGADR